jgi:hypothetical protein
MGLAAPTAEVPTPKSHSLQVPQEMITRLTGVHCITVPAESAPAADLGQSRQSPVPAASTVTIAVTKAFSFGGQPNN